VRGLAARLAPWTGVLTALSSLALRRPPGTSASAGTSALVTVDQATGAVTRIGRPDRVFRISGLAFE